MPQKNKNKLIRRESSDNFTVNRQNQAALE